MTRNKKNNRFSKNFNKEPINVYQKPVKNVKMFDTFNNFDELLSKFKQNVCYSNDNAFTSYYTSNVPYDDNRFRLMELDTKINILKHKISVLSTPRQIIWRQFVDNYGIIRYLPTTC